VDVGPRSPMARSRAHTAHPPVFVIEDDPDLREAMLEVLKEGGHLVYAARDGRDGLDMLCELPRPCLVLVDLVMPRMGGVEFLNHLSRLPEAADFPVLVLSAHAEVEQARVYPGVLGTLQKPFEIGALLSAVDRHSPVRGPGSTSAA
jgi:CheY-like chemotaxis protein